MKIYVGLIKRKITEEKKLTFSFFSAPKPIGEAQCILTMKNRNFNKICGTVLSFTKTSPFNKMQFKLETNSIFGQNVKPYPKLKENS